MIKKVTASLDTDTLEGAKAYEKIINRNRCKYKTITDYILAAVLAFDSEEICSAETDLEKITKYLIEKGYITSPKSGTTVEGVPGV